METDKGYFLEGMPLRNSYLKTEGYNNLIAYVLQDIKKDDQGEVQAVWPRGSRRIENGEKRIDYLVVPVGKWDVPDSLLEKIRNEDYTLTVSFYPRYIRMKLF